MGAPPEHRSEEHAAWGGWEGNTLDHPQTIEQLTAALRKLRILLEEHPRLDDGLWWTQLGGYHMNVHKLMENVLFECELYLGQALLFPRVEVKKTANQNLDGCFAKRKLEAAKFTMIEGLKHALEDRWAEAASALQISIQVAPLIR